MWRVVFVLFVLFIHSAFAECVSVDTVTKCARLPEAEDYLYWGDYTVTDGVVLSDGSWRHFRNGIPVSGTVSIISFVGVPRAECVVSLPFVTSFVLTYPANSSITEADAIEGCAILSVPMQWDFPLEELAVPLEGDICPDGFYTVPYELSCGEGLVDVADIPQCDSDTSGEFCLIGEMPSAPCAAGITTLRTGTGVIVSLWAERGTEPSLCVKYNDTVCYGNLEVGQASGSINIKYNNLIYHLVE